MKMLTLGATGLRVPAVILGCMRMNELDEVGSWFDLMTDCLGFRIMAAFEDTYRRVDGSKRRADVRVGFFIYLRALGPSSLLDLVRF